MTYADPADEIRQALTVIKIEATNTEDPSAVDFAAILAAVERINEVCARGVAWRGELVIARRGADTIYGALCGAGKVSRADFARATRALQVAMGYAMKEEGENGDE